MYAANTVRVRRGILFFPNAGISAAVAEMPFFSVLLVVERRLPN